MIISISREYVSVEVPNILIAGRFIMLACRCPLAAVGVAYGYRYFLDNFIQRTDYIVRNIIYIFVVLVRYDQRLTRIAIPPFRGYRRSNEFILEDYIVKPIKVAFLASKQLTKRTGVTNRFMIKH